MPTTDHRPRPGGARGPGRASRSDGRRHPHASARGAASRPDSDDGDARKTPARAAARSLARGRRRNPVAGNHLFQRPGMANRDEPSSGHPRAGREPAPQFLTRRLQREEPRARSRTRCDRSRRQLARPLQARGQVTRPPRGEGAPRTRLGVPPEEPSSGRRRAIPLRAGLVREPPSPTHRSGRRPCPGTTESEGTVGDRGGGRSAGARRPARGVAVGAHAEHYRVIRAGRVRPVLADSTAADPPLADIAPVLPSPGPTVHHVRSR